MVWIIYNLLFVIGFTLLLPRFLWRMWRRGGYRGGFAQRWASYAPDLRARLAAHPRIWIHAVSVGEMYVALRFIEAIRERYPVAFVVTTTTSTGHAIAKERLQDPDELLYFPIDIPPIVRRALRAIQPRAVLLVDYELWPNLIRHCYAARIPVMLLNGRVSERSFRGYRKLRRFTRRLLPMVDLMAMQGPADGDRLIALGAPAGRVHVVGTPKYETVSRDAAREAEIGRVLASLGWGPDDPILVGGSTWPGEETALVRAFQQCRSRHPNLRLVLVPRHAERANDVLRELETASVQIQRRTRMSADGGGASRPSDLLLVDTTGELRHYYAHAAIIFVGKSLTRTEGQNIIEPALYGRPIVVGPRLDNFESILHDFVEAEAIVQVSDEVALADRIQDLLDHPDKGQTLGERAAGVVRAQAGAVDRTLDLMEPLLKSI